MKKIIPNTIVCCMILGFHAFSQADNTEVCEFSSHGHGALTPENRIQSNPCSDAAIEAALPSCRNFVASTSTKHKKTRPNKKIKEGSR